MLGRVVMIVVQILSKGPPWPHEQVYGTKQGRPGFIEKKRQEPPHMEHERHDELYKCMITLSYDSFDRRISAAASAVLC